MVKVDKKLCKRCSICIELCPQKVFKESSEGFPDIGDEDSCNQCGFCELHCPEFAIEIEKGNR